MRPSLALMGGLALCLGLATTATAQEQPAPVTFVTGTVAEVYGYDVQPDDPHSYEIRGHEVTVGGGGPLRQVIEWSDPRLPTDLWLMLDYTLIWIGEDANELDGAINTASRSLLEDEEGRWRGTGRWVNGGDEPYSFYVLTGEGAYEGLSALAQGTTPAHAEGPWDLACEGYIFEAELTPLPDEPVPVTTEGRQMYPFPMPSPEGVPQEVADPMAPAAFTFTLKPMGEPTWGTERDSEDGRTTEERGTREVQTMEATDPRASGVLTTVRNRNQIEVSGGGVQTYAFRMRLANDGGEWSGTDHGILAFAEGAFGAAGGV